jgi:hypothetical protein
VDNLCFSVENPSFLWKKQAKIADNPADYLPGYPQFSTGF